MMGPTWPVLLLAISVLFGIAAAYPHRTYREDIDGPAKEESVRHIDGLGGGHLLRDTWSLQGLQGLQGIPGLQGLQGLQGRQRRGLDSLSGVTFGGAKKRFDNLSGVTFGNSKRNFDEIDRTSFNSFTKKNFDEIDNAGFNSFVKRAQQAQQALPELEDLERSAYALGPLPMVKRSVPAGIWGGRERNDSP